jgi:hypothetical protein
MLQVSVPCCLYRMTYCEVIDEVIVDQYKAASPTYCRHLVVDPFPPLGMRLSLIFLVASEDLGPNPPLNLEQFMSLLDRAVTPHSVPHHYTGGAS